MKDNLPFFTHDNDAHTHPKMAALMVKFGYAGYGRFWALNEIIAASSGAVLDISRKINKLNLAKYLDFSENELDEFISFLSDEDIDLINFTDGKITTDRTQEDFNRVMKKRQKDRDDKAEKNEKDNSITKTDFSLPKNIQSRVDKSREDINGSSSSRSEYSDSLLVNDSTLPQQNNLIQKIKATALKTGFAVDNNLAKHLAFWSGQGLLDCDLYFLQFVYERVTTSYAQKPIAEQRKIYCSALWNHDGKWSDLWDEYSVLLNAELIKQHSEKQRSKKIKSKPVTCKCGQALGVLGKCPACGSWFEWQDNTWQFIQSVELRENLVDKITQSHVPKLAAG